MRVGTLLGITIGIAACAEAPSPVGPPGGIDEPPVLSAEASSAQLNRAFSSSLWVSCANEGQGEMVVLSGELEILTHSSADASGGTHVSTHVRPSKVVGIGTSTAQRYRGTGGSFEGQQYSAAGEPRVWTFVNNFRIIGQGPGNNVLVHMTMHQTYNANGELTADVDLSSQDCK